MIIKRLMLENIRSYRSLDISFERGSTLLLGDIGSGKSSLLLGLQFALFGLQPGQKGSSLLRHGERVASAAVELELDGEVVYLQRGIRKSKSGGITQDVNIIAVGDEREELSTSEMKTRVINLLHYPKEFAKKSNLLYKFTVYTPQEEMKTIIEERSEVRLDTIRHIFGFDRYKRIVEHANVLLAKIKESVKIKEVLISELQLLREKLQLDREAKIALAREVNTLRGDVSRLREDRDRTSLELKEVEKGMNEVKEIESRLQERRAVLQGKQELLAKLKRDIAAIQREMGEEVEFSSERLNAVVALVTKHKSVLEEHNARYIELNSLIRTLEARRDIPIALREQITSLEHCPTCQQMVGIEHKDKISKKTGFEIDEISHELEQRIIDRTVVMRDIEKVKDLLVGYEEDLRVLREEKVRFEQQKQLKTKLQSEAYILDRTHNEIALLEKEVSALTVRLSECADTASLYTDVTSRLDDLSRRHRLAEIAIASKEKELELATSRLEELGVEIGKKEAIKEEIVYLRNLQDWLSQQFLNVISLTEKQVLSKLRLEFSSVFADWFGLLVTGDLTVRLDEDFTPIISSQDYELDYSFLSGGERTAVALAYRLALHQVLNSMMSRLKTKELVILDEPTDGFSSEQIDKMRDLFDALSVEQLILVSHEQKMEGFVDHVVRVSKGEESAVEAVSSS